MSVNAETGYAGIALRMFPELLVELIRSDAPYNMLRAEGFSPREIEAARVLVGLVDSTERLDPGDQAGGDAEEALCAADETTPVTGPAG